MLVFILCYQQMFADSAEHLTSNIINDSRSIENRRKRIKELKKLVTEITIFLKFRVGVLRHETFADPRW